MLTPWRSQVRILCRPLARLHCLYSRVHALKARLREPGFFFWLVWRRMHKARILPIADSRPYRKGCIQANSLALRRASRGCAPTALPP